MNSTVIEATDELMKGINDFDTIKDKLVFRLIPLISIANDEEFIGTVIDDVAMVLYIQVGRKDGWLCTTKVKHDMFDSWGRTFDEIKDYVFKRMAKEQPVSGMDMFSFTKCGLKDFSGDCGTYLVTTEPPTNGAIAIFYPGVCKEIADKFNSDFYIVFTSIHEAVVHKKGTTSVESMYKSLRDTNKAFGPEDTLTDTVFFYNKEADTITITKEYED